MPVADVATLILACDGVWDVFDDVAAAAIVAAAPPATAAEALVRAALAKGSTDNITAVVVSWPSEAA